MIEPMPDSQMCLTFAGDEAGDASFSFDEGASTHFVLALIATAQPDVLRGAMALLREQRGLPADYEFKYHKLSSAGLRRAVIERLQAMDFAVYALTVDKTTLPVYLRALDAHSLYALLAAELIVQVPLSEREGAILLLDEFDPRGRALLALKRALKRRGIRRGFRKMLNVRSRSEPLVQIADLVAGAILRAVAQGDGESLSRLQHQTRLLYHFQVETKNPPS
ncbi:MAG: hypothetical protein CVU38_01355 [Chloroflexi bacterium HGW-Chloroflexi-1]|nr:MAG: hypothetical protein CVU38_01355 [Chloroflexi bacterium HGW-Chloroflexi-1]